MKPEEVSADKVYGTINNRAYLEDNEIVSNINFYDDENIRENYKRYDIKMFEVAEDLHSAKCPTGVESVSHIIDR